MDESLSLHFLHFVSSLAGYCLGIGLFFFDIALVSFYFWFMGQLVFLPHSCIASAVVSLNLCLLGPFRPARYYSFSYFKLPSISTRSVFISSWASSAYFIPLDIPGLLHSFRHPWLISFLQSQGLLLNLLGFPNLITISLTFGVCWPLHQSHLLIPFFGLLQSIFACFLLLTIPIGLLLPSLGLPWAYLLSLRPFYYFVGLCTIVPTIWT